MAQCDISPNDLATAFTSSSIDGESCSSEATMDMKKRKTHRLKQRFQVVKKLGQGTYGKVQLAINNETGQEVAIKTIKKNKVSSQQDLVRIRREIQIMSSINHPNIIHIFEVFENKDKIVLVMQYASGGELYDYVSFHKALSDSEARRVFRQVATAIYYCHKNKICHRDLKLENILLDEKGNAKIADFGLSNVFDDKHFLQTFCGSPLYASPEIVRGLPYFGPEVDCWSLGVLLYTLVYGAMPFDGSNFKKLVKQISEASYYEPAEKSPASDLIHKLLAPDPKERASIIDICTDEWVNQDSEHMLLQVAEDLSNLTKHAVRLDMLLALAPGSPTDAPKQPIKDKETENENIANKRPNESSANASAADVSKNSKKKTKKEEPTAKAKKEKKSVMQEFQENIEKVNSKTDIESGKTSIIEEDDVMDQTTRIEKNELSEMETDDNKSQNNLKTIESTNFISNPEEKISTPIISNGLDSSQQPSKPSIDEKKKSSTIKPGLFSVSELKSELEKKAIKSTNQIKRRETLADASELKLDLAEKKKQYKNRTQSLNLAKIRSDFDSVDISKSDEKKVTEEMNETKQQTEILSEIEMKKQIKEQNEEINQSKSIESIKETTTTTVEQRSSSTSSFVERTESLEEMGRTSKTSSTSSIKDDKSLAKQIIQKNIAKAKLMEKRQTSLKEKSGETTPLISIENSTISVTHTGSPAPTSGSNSNIFFKKTNLHEDREVMNVPVNAAPITRSYKKVMFTKDGAKITETGKFFTHEGEDGVTTTVEKTSRITHIIKGDNGESVNLERSDSQSSTGSLDIFDDIFDDHWTGDNLFSNVKSLFNDFFGRRNNEKLSLRSRAESLERTNYFPNESSDNIRASARKISSKENRGSNSVFGSQSSLFSTKSVFSNSSFSKNSAFSKDFDIDDLFSSARTKLDDRKKEKYSSALADDGSSFFSRSRIFEEESGTATDSARKRMEQWFSSEDEKDFDLVNTYGTIRPRTRQFTRTITNNDFKKDIIQNVQISNSSSSSFIKQKTSTIKSKNFVPRDSELQLNFTLDDSVGNGSFSINQFVIDEKRTSTTSSTANSSRTDLIDLKLEEPSSLLEQLRTLGYKNLVNRRLSDSSPVEEETVSESSSSVLINKSSSEKDQSLRGDSKYFIGSTESSNIDNILGSRALRRKSLLFNDNEDGQSRIGARFVRTESVQERILRKSYYSRFNDPIILASCRDRRRSLSRLNDSFSSSSSSPSINNSLDRSNLGLGNGLP
ncbi:hypothetical protein NH340_JMT06309 [Sarcoptes scabiei]|nr:hypothetical protein NH340_JMT06309 [Sarcoptes scabiei]